MSSTEASERQNPIHFSQHYLPSLKESDLDFFDVNLEYDSKLFIDPFLIKRSSVAEEVELFKKFGDFFSHAYDQSLKIKTADDYESFKNFLNFHEPKEICLGYTESSHSGSGLGPSFASLFTEFFINNTARRLINEKDLFPDKQFNPITFGIFIDGNK